MGGKGGLLSRWKSRLKKCDAHLSVIRVGPTIRARWFIMFKITLEIVTLDLEGPAAVTSKNPPVPPINHIVKVQFLSVYGMVFWRTEGFRDGFCHGKRRAFHFKTCMMHSVGCWQTGISSKRPRSDDLVQGLRVNVKVHLRVESHDADQPFRDAMKERKHVGGDRAGVAVGRGAGSREHMRLLVHHDECIVDKVLESMVKEHPPWMVRIRKYVPQALLHRGERLREERLGLEVFDQGLDELPTAWVSKKNRYHEQLSSTRTFSSMETREDPPVSKSVGCRREGPRNCCTTESKRRAFFFSSGAFFLLFLKQVAWIPSSRESVWRMEAARVANRRACAIL